MTETDKPSSSGFAVVVLQDAAQALAALNLAGGAADFAARIDQLQKDLPMLQEIAKTLASIFQRRDAL